MLGASVLLPFSPLAPLLGLVPPPIAYWPGLAPIRAAYGGLTLLVKSWLIRRSGIG